VLTLRRGLLRALLAALAAGGAFAAFAVLGAAAAPAAGADGDPGSDVLVYQNLFVAADASMPIPRQLQLGYLLADAGRRGFAIRVAIISQRSDLGAITALWGKPDAYARFLGTELSLAYAQRLLIVMPDGFGFNWQGHQAADAYRELAALRVPAGGDGLAVAAESAVRALASASGIRLAQPALGSAPAASAAPAAPAAPAAAASVGPASVGLASSGPTSASVAQPEPSRASSPGFPAPLIAALAATALAVAGLGGRLAWRTRRARRAGVAPGRPLFPSLAGRGTWVRGTWVAGGFAGLAVLALVSYTAAEPVGGQAQIPLSPLAGNPNLDPGTPLSATAPGFTLTDQFGQQLSLSDYRGKVVILAFNDAECTTICPLTTAALADAKAMLGAAASGVQLLGIDANPKATQVQDVLSYSQLHGMTYRWRYLTGSLAQLKSVWRAYSVGVTISQSQTDHEPAIFVISPQGRLARLFLTQAAYSAVPQLGQLLANEAASLLPGHPKVRSDLSYAQVSDITPAAASQLPAAGGGYVTLGPSQPAAARLYLFFATWDQEITSLAGHLGALDAYQSAAAGAAGTGLPGLTAIDEGSVEPSDAALPSFLAALRRPLSYPVAIDGSGQVADGYGVQGQPWFLLASPSGKVIWSLAVSTSGWPSLASLERHVRAALSKPTT
jgi:cytochrome oxidase Cu insertion factor (SCO1/SenC/PrrC family)